MNKQTKGYLYAFISMVLLALGYILNFYLTQHTTAESAAFLLFGFGTLIAIAISFRYATKKDVKHITKHGKHLLAFGVLNGIGALLWFQTVQSAGPLVTGFLLRFATIFTILLGVLFLKERFNKGEIAGILLVVGGAFTITYTDVSLLSSAVLAIIASFLFALVALISSVHLKAVRPLVLNNVRIAIMFCMIASYTLLAGRLSIPGPGVLAVAALSALLTIVTALLLFFKALRLIGLSKVAVIGALEPFFIVIFSFLILQRVPTPAQLAGGMVIMLGIGVLLYFRKKPKLVTEELE
ncbi:MAG: DMT family transporter [Candidatus Aenigmarchaeota archaeon]|nr:DMT family transporter [Candidatus Aenigmarchaeota archaeon]